MFKYKTDGMKSVCADSGLEAARVFFERLARKEFGRFGVARAIRCESWASDGSYATYQGFVGKHDRHNDCTTGHNKTIFIESVDA